MTTLLSKGFGLGLELEQNLRRQVGKAREQVGKELEERGLRLSAEDLALLLEEWSPASSRSALSFVVDFLRSFPAGMGLRVSRLSDTQIEMVLPARAKNLRGGVFHEGALITAGIEAALTLWERHAPLGEFKIELMTVGCELHRSTGHELRVRAELAETARETVLSQLRQGGEAASELEVQLLDEGGQRVADLALRLRMRLTPALSSPEV